MLVPLAIFSNSVAAGAIKTALPSISPKAEDFSRALIATTRSTTRKITFEALDNSMDVIDRILSASSKRVGDPDVLSVGPAKDSALISVNRKRVSRAGNLLQLGSAKGKPLKFRDGMGETFVYAGPIGISGYQKVDAFGSFDPKGFYLVNPEKGTAIFMRTKPELASISPDQKLLALMNNGLSSPFSILAATLSENGYSIDLQCQSHLDGGVRQRIIPFFKGWHGNAGEGFDIVLLVQRLDDDPTPRFEAMPVRFSLKDSEWHVFVPDPQRFMRMAKLTCWH
ncbi:MAG: hypothetical protein KA388_00105 [Rhodocyclaceae bacterium]|nr:hypothetical protein [Rhodocyclaceae bacterium]